MTLWETAPDPGPIRLEDYEAWKSELGAPSKGLMQIIEPSYRTEYDPLANMTAAIEYARSEYAGTWNDDMVRPRRGGKATAIEKAMVIAREAGMVSGEGFASGGLIPSPTGRLSRVRLSPGEFVLTPEATSEFARRMEAAMVELNDMERVPEPPDDYPEPPTAAPF